MKRSYKNILLVNDLSSSLNTSKHCLPSYFLGRFCNLAQTNITTFLLIYYYVLGKIMQLLWKCQYVCPIGMNVLDIANCKATWPSSGDRGNLYCFCLCSMNFCYVQIFDIITFFSLKTNNIWKNWIWIKLTQSHSKPEVTSRKYINKSWCWYWLNSQNITQELQLCSQTTT